MKNFKFILLLVFLLPTVVVFAQDYTVSGVVKDESGETLPGVSIAVKGTSSGTMTDLDGIFQINVSPNSILVFSYIGFKEQRITVSDQKKLTIILIENDKLLDEVVVVGYGTQRKIDVTGSISSINREEITSVSTANMANALQGKVPGLNIKQDTGEPGEYANNIKIRGFGDALVIIDGIPRNDFNRLDPNEVESVSVLKDASAAIYGVRAANGVILVTTRKGSKKKTEITLNTTYGFQQPTKYPKAANAYQYMELYNEALANGGATNPTYNPEMITSGTPYANINWYDEIVKKTAPQYQANLSISGGDDRVQYFNSIGYYKEEGLWKTNSLEYERFNLRSNVTAKITDQLTSEFKIGGYVDFKDSPAYTGQDIFTAIGACLPIYEIYANGNPDYLGKQYNDEANPLIKSSTQYGGYSKRKNLQLQISASLRWDIPFVKGLYLKGLVAYDPKFSSSKLLKKQYKTYSYDKATDMYSLATTSAISNISEWKNESASLTTQLSANYENSFLDKHNVKALLLLETRKWDQSELSGGRNTLMDIVEQIYAGLIDDARVIGGTADRNANVGLVGRIDYDYMSKYLIQASFRYDGSSKFYNKKWGFFPSVSLGWRVSEEPFIKNNFNFVNNLKIRASIGKMGDDNTDPYLWLRAFDYPGSDRYILGDGGLIPGVGIPAVPNPNATWFTSTIKNIGFELNLWNGKLTAEFDLFRRDRDGLLASRIVSIPGTFGSPFAKENLNSDLQQGFELVLGHTNQYRDFIFHVKGNLTYTIGKNKYIERAPSGNSYDNWRNNNTDRNRDIVWMYDVNGQYRNIEEIYNSAVLEGLYSKYNFLPGDIRYVDYNEDGIIDDWDKQPLKRGNIPLLNYGLILGLEWKGIDLNMTFQGAALFNADMKKSPLQWGGNAWEMSMDRWRKVDADGNTASFDPNARWVPGKLPSTRIDDPQNYGQTSSFWYKNCAYLRLKNVEIGYTFPRKLTIPLGIQSLRLFANGFNLLTIQSKDMDYLDPETSQLSQYPIMKNYNFGFNVNF